MNPGILIVGSDTLGHSGRMNVAFPADDMVDTAMHEKELETLSCQV